MIEVLNAETEQVSGGDSQSAAWFSAREAERSWAELLAALDAQTPGTPGHLG